MKVRHQPAIQQVGPIVGNPEMKERISGKGGNGSNKIRVDRKSTY